MQTYLTYLKEETEKNYGSFKKSIFYILPNLPEGSL